MTAGWHIAVAVILLALAAWLSARAVHPERTRGATDDRRLAVLDGMHISRRGWLLRLRIGNALMAIGAATVAVVLLATV